MEELAYMNREVDKHMRRRAEKLMKSVRQLDAIIEAQKLEIPQRLTTNYDAGESQPSNQFHSETEKTAEYREKIDRHIRTKRKLERLYSSMSVDQQRIWDMRYLDGRTDVYVFNELHISERTYYRLKREMIQVVAEAFFF